MTTRINLRCLGTLPTVLAVGLLLIIATDGHTFPSAKETNKELFTAVTGHGSAKVASGPTIMRARLINVNFELLPVPDKASGGQAGTINALTLNLVEDVTLSAVFDRIERRSQDSFTWFGHIQGTETR